MELSSRLPQLLQSDSLNAKEQFNKSKVWRFPSIRLERFYSM
jgi:hypothetical protein